MNVPPKKVPSHWKCVLDEETIARSISRISYEIVERNRNLESLAIIGIRTGGEHLAKRLCDRIKSIENFEVPFGVIDITLYRDDLWNTSSQPTVKGTELRFPVSGRRVVLVDDILYTGRTIRAALDAIIDFGRPDRVELATLVDRGHRELPIRPDYVGKNIPTRRDEFVRARLRELGYVDGVYLIRPKQNDKIQCKQEE